MISKNSTSCIHGVENVDHLFPFGNGTHCKIQRKNHRVTPNLCSNQTMFWWLHRDLLYQLTQTGRKTVTREKNNWIQMWKTVNCGTETSCTSHGLLLLSLHIVDIVVMNNSQRLNRRSTLEVRKYVELIRYQTLQQNNRFLIFVISLF